MPGDTWVSPPITVQRVAKPTPNNVIAQRTARAGTVNARNIINAANVAHGVPAVGTKPSNTVLPAISGTPRPTNTLSVDTGTWTGTATITYTYKWRRDGVVIAGQTASSYTVLSTDVGHVISCKVIATNSWGSASVNSAGVTITSGATPPSGGVPSLSGSFLVGGVIACDHGSWVGDATITYAYQWKRDGTAISGQTSSTYTAVSADATHDLICTVTATNGAGSASADSESETIVGSPGPVVPFTLADLGHHRYAPSDPAYDATKDTDQLAPRYVDLYLDKLQFGRTDKVQPISAHQYPGELIIKADGTQDTTPGSGSTGGTIPFDGTKGVTLTVNGDGTKTLHFDLQCQGIHVAGNDWTLILTGKLWIVNPFWTGAGDRDEFNALNDSSLGYFFFEKCMPALQNVYIVGGPGGIPMGRFSNTRGLTSTTPYIDGFWLRDVIRDCIKSGSGTQGYYLRHGTISAHPYSRTWIHPPDGGINIRSESGDTDKPYIWKPDKLYAALDCVIYPDPAYNPSVPYASGDHVSYLNWNYKAKSALPAGTTPPSNGVTDANWSVDFLNENFYALNGGTNLALPANTFGQHNTNWQFYGNPHSDFQQIGNNQNESGRPSCENVWFYGANHACLFAEGPADVLGSKVAVKSNGPYNPASTYNGFANPDKTHPADVVSVTGGRQYYCATTNVTGIDPTTDDGTHWKPLTAHGHLLDYCIVHGANSAIFAPGGDTSNGLKRSIVIPNVFSATIVSGGSGNGGGVNNGVTNDTNVFADGSGSIPGSA
jgi:hypothetical protein